MKITIRKFGSSIGLIIPKQLREQFNLRAGQVINLEATDAGLLIKPHRRKYKLANLMSENDRNAATLEDIIAWRNAPAVGKEITPP